MKILLKSAVLQVVDGRSREMDKATSNVRKSLKSLLKFESKTADDRVSDEGLSAQS